MADGTAITIQSEDKGTVIKGTAYTRTDGVDAVIDLNDLSAITILIRDPDGVYTTATASAENVDGGTDGIFTYTTASTIFTKKPGIWKIQVQFTYSAGDILHSQIKNLVVGEVLE